MHVVLGCLHWGGGGGGGGGEVGAGGGAGLGKTDGLLMVMSMTTTTIVIILRRRWRKRGVSNTQRPKLQASVYDSLAPRGVPENKAWSVAAPVVQAQTMELYIGPGTNRSRRQCVALEAPADMLSLTTSVPRCGDQGVWLLG